MITRVRGLSKGACMSLLTLIVSTSLYAANLEMEFKLEDGKGKHTPMVVVWLEDTEGNFVRTIQMFSNHKKYYKSLKEWRTKSGMKDLDGVTGATLEWGSTRIIKVPVKAEGINLLDGKYVLRIESKKKKGKSHKEFSIPLPKGYKGGVHKYDGHVEKVTIAVK